MPCSRVAAGILAAFARVATAIRRTGLDSDFPRKISAAASPNVLLSYRLCRKYLGKYQTRLLHFRLGRLRYMR